MTLPELHSTVYYRNNAGLWRAKVLTIYHLSQSVRVETEALVDETGATIVRNAGLRYTLPASRLTSPGATP